MKLIGAFLKLIRWPNLVFISITQILFYYAFVRITEGSPFQPYNNLLTPPLFLLLALASVSIAAGGYIINDYFDLNIDKINKPSKLVVDKMIRRRWAIVWHMVLSFIGVVLSFYISYKIGNILIGLLNLVSVLLLWFYSTSFKKKLLIGNIIISLLTAWVILVLYISELRLYMVFISNEQVYQRYIRQLFKIAILYGSFAFIISIIREVIKDIEDIRGDEQYECRTMPIVWGIPVAKVFAGTWLVVLVGALVIILFYVIQLGWWWFAAYSVGLIIFPLLYILRALYKASSTAAYHRISSLLKFVMFTGILSMVLFKFYHTKGVFGF
jgi:4-hydroxybenzoate polyprenyltransferase